jgi:hypothetical protein
MVSARHITIAATIATVGIITFFVFFSGDEAKIKKQIKILAELVSKDPDEHPFVGAANAQKIGDMFAETCRFEIPSHSISRSYQRETIPAQIMAARSQYSTISLKFHDIKISFPKEGTAQISLTSYVEALWGSGEPIREVSEFICLMNKAEKDWHFSQIEGISVLER